MNYYSAYPVKITAYYSAESLHGGSDRISLKAAKSATFELLFLEIMFLIFTNTVKIQIYILPVS